MRFEGREIENADALQPGQFYYLTEAAPRVVHHRDGTKGEQPRVRASKRNSKATIARIRVYLDRLGRRRADAARKGAHS